MISTSANALLAILLLAIIAYISCEIPRRNGGGCTGDCDRCPFPPCTKEEKEKHTHIK